MEKSGVLKDIALCVVAAVAGLAPWLSDKVGIEMPKPLSVSLLIFSAILFGWAFSTLGWVERIPMVRGRKISLSDGILWSVVLLTGAWLILRVQPKAEYDYKKYQSDRNETISRRSYLNETVEIDGKTFDHCKFSNVTFLYHGLAGTTFLEAEFEGTTLFKTDNQAAKGALLMESFLRNNPKAAKFVLGDMDSSTGNMRVIEKMEKTEPPKEKQESQKP